MAAEEGGGVADMKVQVQVPDDLRAEVDLLVAKVDRAAEVAGTARATADALQHMARHLGTELAVSPSAAAALEEFAAQLLAACEKCDQVMLGTATVRTGDVVQVDPEKDDVFGAAYATVEKVEGWGIRAYVRIPGQGDALVRVNHGDYKKVGMGEWIHDPLAVVDEPPPAGAPGA